MMFYISKQLNQVSIFFPYFDNLILVKNGKLLINEEVFNCTPSLILLSNHEVILWIKDAKWENYYIDLKSKKLNKVSYLLGLNSITRDYILTFENGIQKIISANNLLEPVILKATVSLQSYLIFNDKLIGYSKTNFICSTNRITGEFEWETNLSGRKYLIKNEEQEAYIIAILGVYESHLLVWLAGDRLISIDTNNGTILYEILPFEGLVDVNGFQLWDFRDLFLEQETGKIIMLNKLFYYEIDILTQQVQQCKSFYTGNAYGLGRLPNMPEPPTDITFKQAVYTNYFIYFIGGYTFATNIVGVFNRKTYNIDWQESINLLETDNFNNFKDIQYANNKIYVLDTAGNLHVFEKEE